MADWALLRHPRVTELWRYGQAGAINAAFGFGAYSLLVWLGMNIFVAQILATVCGIAFNYITYSRHVFREQQAGRFRFLLAYAGNYLVSLVMLALFSRIVASPYAAGALAICASAALNYFTLRYLVFLPKAT